MTSMEQVDLADHFAMCWIAEEEKAFVASAARTLGWAVAKQLVAVEQVFVAKAGAAVVVATVADFVAMGLMELVEGRAALVAMGCYLGPFLIL